MTMTSARTLRSLLTPAALAALFAAAPEARAVTVTFNSDNEFTSNFHAYPVAGGAYSQSAATGNLAWTTTGAQTGNFVYDTNGNTAGGVFNFIPGAGNSVVVAFDFSTSVANSSVGVYFGGVRSAEYLALFNVNTSAANDRLRIFGNTSNATTGAVGSVLSGATANSGVNNAGVVDLASGGWTLNTTYRATLTLTYTSANVANVTYLISDPYTAVNPVASFSISASGLAVSSTLNEIGFRTGMASSAGAITIDNLSITTTAVPEPASYAAFGGLAALGFAALRRRRRA